MPFFEALIISLVLQVAGFLLMPKPKQPKPPSAEDFEDPTAEAGRPIPVVFGSVTVTGLNVMWFGDKSVRRRKAAGGGKK